MQKSDAKTYTNPVGGILMGDPFVLFSGGTYYLYGTTDPNIGFRVYTSANLVDWTEVGFAYRQTDVSWGKPPYWAPEVFEHRKKYYMTYSARHPETGRLLTALAVADDPAGPFEDLHTPWFNFGYSAIDSHLFRDDDGSMYVYFSKNGQQDGYSFGIIYAARVSDDLSEVYGPPTLLMQAEQPWERISYHDNRANEGSFVFKQNGTYYMTYSANHTFRPGYGIGYATAETPLGPWTKFDGNPIAGTDMSVGYSGAGHNSITFSPDGTERFIVYHTHADPENPGNQIRSINIDRLEIGPDSVLRILGPTRSPVPFPSGSR